MDIRNPHLPLFYEPSHSTQPIRLHATGATVHSVTAETPVAKSTDGTIYYIKQLSGEYQQLVALQTAGIAVPERIMRDARGTLFATSHAGTPLFEALVASPHDATQLLFGSGSLLRDIHHALNAQPPIYTPTPTFATTSHIVDCFFYKYVGVAAGVAERSYRQHKQSVAAGYWPASAALPASTAPFITPSHSAHPGLQTVIATINRCAARCLAQLSPYRVGKKGSYIAILDDGLCYGDFKPDNILVQTSPEKQTSITIIDPSITAGSTVFDVAKYTARTLIDRLHSRTPFSLAPFYEGYGQAYDARRNAYGPYTFPQLITIDLLNIFRSYIRRYLAGNKTYRLVRALDDPAYCSQVATLIDGLAAADTNTKLTRLLQ